jgi:trehalose 6-phosphate phosphatase
VEPLLDRLASVYAVVAVVSGRPVEYLRRRLPGAGMTELVGLYGLERARSRSADPEVVAAAEPWRIAVREAAEEADKIVPPGVLVERKGLAVTLHYRAVPGEAARVTDLARAVAGRAGLAWHPGKMSVELRPPVDTDKGSVVAELSSGLVAVCFVGDDRGDLPAFDELAGMRSRGAATLSVAVSGAETPEELLSRSDLVVEGPDGVLGLLRELEAGAAASPG